jgi:hypothetical protein
MNAEKDIPAMIVGAGRSGTNFLGHVLEHDPRLWNSYENRYIWNYGQRRLRHDVRRPEEATPPVKSFIRGFFRKLAAEKDRVIIDKTPSNIFRMAFIHEVFPEARIVHIIRDGRDNVLSRRHEWFGGRDVAAQKYAGYFTKYRIALLGQRLQHVRTLLERGNLPVSRWMAFLADNASSFLSNFVGGEPKRYGERFPGMKECLAAYGLLETSAIQWQLGVMTAVTEGRRLPVESYLEVRYEDLLSAPEREWKRFAEFLNLEENGPARDWLLAQARRDNFGKWRDEMTDQERTALEAHLRPTLEFLGYAWDT